MADAAYNGGASPSWFSRYTAIGASLAGISGDVSVIDNEFDGGKPLRAVIATGSGGASTVYSIDGGVVGNSTGTGAASGSVRMYGAQILGGNPKYVANIRTSRWFFVARLALLNTNVDAGQTAIGAGLSDGGVSYRVNLGLNAAASAANFSMSDTGGATTLVSSTPIDVAFHDFIGWNDATNVHFRVDLNGSTARTAAGTLSTVAAEWEAFVTTGTGFQNVGYKIDKILVVTAGAA